MFNLQLEQSARGTVCALVRASIYGTDSSPYQIPPVVNTNKINI